MSWKSEDRRRKSKARKFVTAFRPRLVAERSRSAITAKLKWCMGKILLIPQLLIEKTAKFAKKTQRRKSEDRRRKMRVGRWKVSRSLHFDFAQYPRSRSVIPRHSFYGWYQIKKVSNFLDTFFWVYFRMILIIR